MLEALEGVDGWEWDVFRLRQASAGRELQVSPLLARAAAAAVPLGTRYRSGNGLGQRRTVKQPAFLKFPVAGADGEGTLLLQSPPTWQKAQPKYAALFTARCRRFRHCCCR